MTVINKVNDDSGSILVASEDFFFVIQCYKNFSCNLLILKIIDMILDYLCLFCLFFDFKKVPFH
ncbi:hypothetical protein C3391_10890 [Citrobacter freundii complex sp. CFNIH8]|nr:hypothetical protein CUC48_13885 [Citrobacter freundii]POU21479.1 hypothetical protein C3391_10890 [Citrobacter freundii complex sp. CFNIH8]QBI31265.1 hypothetical protein WN16_20010 [Citrobacter sp. ABFQG]